MINDRYPFNPARMTLSYLIIGLTFIKFKWLEIFKIKFLISYQKTEVHHFIATKESFGLIY